MATFRITDKQFNELTTEYELYGFPSRMAYISYILNNRKKITKDLTVVE